MACLYVYPICIKSYIKINTINNIITHRGLGGFPVELEMLNQQMKSAQIGRNVSYNILKLLFLLRNVAILYQIALKLASKYTIYNRSSLVQVMSWRRKNKDSFRWRIYVSLDLNEFMIAAHFGTILFPTKGHIIPVEL